MSYQVNFTETSNPSKPSITVQDQSLDALSTSLTFVGKNYAGYARPIAENFLHLLENFAKTTAPSNPVQGQLWYDNNPGVNLIKVYDSTNWIPVGGVKKADSAPDVSSSVNGDLWVDTNNRQLYLYTGSNWTLVGPQYSEGSKTGPMVETIIDTNDEPHNVITLYAEDYRIAIVSSAAFTPKATLLGFASIGQGVNLSNYALSSTNTTKFWGRVSEADALNILGTTVSASNFLRSDVTSTTNNPFNIRNNGGISLGSDLNFNIFTDNNTPTLYSRIAGQSVEFKLNSSGSSNVPAGNYTAVRIDPNGRIGLGVNNTNPKAMLDVSVRLIDSDIESEVVSIPNTLGIYTDGKVKIVDTTDSTGLSSLNTASLWTDGGLTVGKSSYFGGAMNVYGTINVSKLDSNNDPTTGAVIAPGPTDAVDTDVDKKYDIGTPTRTFRNIYAESFVGSFVGSISGNLTGNVSGTAAKLASATPFSLTGEIAADAINFDGQPESGAVVFVTKASTSLIKNKPLIATSDSDDLLLVYRENRTLNGQVIPGGLRSVTKQTFISSIPSVPVGALFAFAGNIPPAGYLLCDGSEVLISTYATLFSVIGYSYKSSALLQGSGTFGLPDLRGRFTLGRDNMDNNITVPSKGTTSIPIKTSGGALNRTLNPGVTNPAADVVGGTGGAESVQLTIDNLPEHTHTLRSGTTQYYAIAPGTPGSEQPVSAGETDCLVTPNTGGVNNSILGRAVDKMNPYMTVNYIIYTGVIS